MGDNSKYNPNDIMQKTENFSPFLQQQTRTTLHSRGDFSRSIKNSLIEDSRSVKDILKHCELLHGIAISMADARLNTNIIKEFDTAYHLVEEKIIKLSKNNDGALNFEEVNSTVQLLIYALAKELSENSGKSISEHVKQIKQKEKLVQSDSKNNMMPTQKKPGI